MQDDVNQEECEQDEIDGMKKEADSTGKVMRIYMRAICNCICNEEDTDGRARVTLTADEERVLRVD